MTPHLPFLSFFERVCRRLSRTTYGRSIGLSTATKTRGDLEGGSGTASPAIDERVLQLVRDHWEGAKVHNVQINERLPHFFRGALYIASIYDANDEEHENYVYGVGEELRRYDDLRQLGAAVGKSSPWAEMLQGAFQFVGISGVIAIIITATICYMLVSGPVPKIPKELNNSFTLILGFYFGTAVRKATAVRSRTASPAIEERVLQLVRDHWKGANVNVDNVQINERLPRFFRGTLYIASIYDARKEEHENYVYAVGEELRRYDDLRQLGADVGKSSPWAEMLQKAFQFVGISGVIAIIITATICYLLVSRPVPKIPEELNNSLTLILGFYFGTAVLKAAD